jgi:exosortase/archaeosortase family protein
LGFPYTVGPFKLSRPNAYLLVLAVVFLIPDAIPKVGIDYTYFFIFILVFFAWLLMKWETFQSLTSTSTFYEAVLGISVVVAVFAVKIALSSREGILDMVFIFGGLAVAFFGIRSFRLFWVPAVYGIVLLLGYQVENDIPNYVALQDWMASLMASSMNVLGIATTTSGHLVTLNANSASPLVLDVESDCTGIQGVLAFGVLSSMALVDIKKPKLSRAILLFIIGFAGVFLINIFRLFLVFVTFEYLGVSIGETVHVYGGYTLFVIWILIFWTLAFRYMTPKPATVVMPVTSPSSLPD